MIHFIRTKENKTLLECEVTKEDLHCSVGLEEYSNYLLNTEDKQKFIQQISELYELRSLWWEVHEDSGKFKSKDDFVKYHFLKVVKEFDLSYVTD